MNYAVVNEVRQVAAQQKKGFLTKASHGSTGDAGMKGCSLKDANKDANGIYLNSVR